MSLWRLRVKRHHYISDVDGSREPYRVYVPKGYGRRKACPLLVLLHGAGGDERGFIGDELTALADAHGYILLVVRGRRLTFYDGVGERDVFDAMRRVRKRYKVDDERIYLMGVSMGGCGAWRLGVRHPDLFAALVPICGWSDWRLWYRKWFSPIDAPRELPDWQRPLLLRADALSHARRLVHTPAFIMHGARDDVVNVEHSRRMFRKLRRLGADVVYREYSRAGHEGFASRWRSVFEWLDGKRKRSRIDGRYVGPPSPAGVKRLNTDAARPALPAFSLLPIGDAFARPFRIVAGGSAADRHAAARFAATWEGWMLPRDDDGRPKGRCVVLDHRRVTAKQIADFNLILFGRPETHAVLARIADRLPLHLGGDAALILRHTNPLNPARDVVVWTDHLPLCPKQLEALPWMMPQYVAFDPRMLCRRTSHPEWSAFDARLAEEGARQEDVPIEEQPMRYLPDCFLDAGYL
jgi:predicted esterase